MQQDIFAFNVFIDRFYKQNIKKNFKSMSFLKGDSLERWFLDLQPIKANLKNF